MPVSGSSLQRVAAVAECQRGRVARRQLISAGITSSAIGRLIELGLLHREHAGVYVVSGSAQIPMGRETAALLACGDRAVLSHTTAAAVWQLIPERAGPVEITPACSGVNRRRPGTKLHRSGKLLQRDVSIHEGLPLTSPAWTVVDLGSCLDRRAYERVFDEALVVRKFHGGSALARAPSGVRDRRFQLPDQPLRI